MRFKDKVVLVTGAASGMGKGQALGFVKEGAKVVAADISETGLQDLQETARVLGGEILTVKTDVSSLDALAALVGKCLEKHGTIDILCNTAGINDMFLPVLETTEELWDQVMNTDLKASFRLIKLVLPTMMEQKKGVIINVASISGFVAAASGTAYTAAKHGLVGLTKEVDSEYGLAGIRVNAICPGPVKTGMSQFIFDYPDYPGVPEFQKAVATTPAGRWGEVDDVTSLTLFLASDESDFIHGQSICIDGGWTIR